MFTLQREREREGRGGEVREILDVNNRLSRAITLDMTLDLLSGVRAKELCESRGGCPGFMCP